MSWQKKSVILLIEWRFKKEDAGTLYGNKEQGRRRTNGKHHWVTITKRRSSTVNFDWGGGVKWERHESREVRPIITKEEKANNHEGRTKAAL